MFQESPFLIKDICKIILSYTIGYSCIRPLFCVNKTFNDITKFFYKINTVNPCDICFEHNKYKYFELDCKHRLMRYRIKYFYNDVCEDCLYTATKKICVKCNVEFMMHDGFRGRQVKCGYCMGLPATYNIISPEGFPLVINKLNII